MNNYIEIQQDNGMFIDKCLYCGYKTEPGWEGNPLNELETHMFIEHGEKLSMGEDEKDAE